jgi:circadian clock protein KaiB
VKSSGSDKTAAALEAQCETAGADVYSLRLYVLGASYKSIQAIARTRAVCEQHLAGRYDLKVIDLYQHPGMAAQGGIVATPTLVREAPTPRRLLVGDLSNSDSVLRALGVAA